MHDKWDVKTYFFEDFKLDTSKKLLLQSPSGEAVSLTNKAYEVLLMLVENSGKLLTKDELMARVWKDSFVEEANLTQTISVLRKTLGESPTEHRFIVTESGKGYRFVAKVKKADEAKPIKKEQSIKEISHPAKEFNDANPTPLKGRRYILTIIGVITIFSLSGFYYLGENSASRISVSDAFDWTKATTKPLTNREGIEYFPSIAPDGNSFIFASKNNDNFDIFLRRIDGNKEINLTENSKEDDTQPTFSGDGKLIAFRSERDGGGIFVMEETGENPRRISDFGYHPTWSPDGMQIAFSERSQPRPLSRTRSSLWIVNLETGEKRKLMGDRVHQPSWSPNGKRIAFWTITDEDSKRDVATISIEGGQPIIIENPASENWNPVWSPDGKYLFYSSNRSGNMAFWRVRIDESTGKSLGVPDIVPTPGKFNGHMSFSKDGKRLIYVQMDYASNLKAVEFDPDEGKPKGESYWITRGDYEINNPKLSPDGKDFVVTLARLTQDDIVLINREGKNWRDLTEDKYFNRYPTFSPDGKKITYTSDRSGIHQIWMMNSDGSNLRQITNNQASTSFPIWSPDGRKLIYRTENFRNFIINPNRDLAQQTPTEIPVEEGMRSIVHWDWSPDGNKLAGRWGKGNNNNGIGYFSLETNEYVKLWTGRSSMPRWLPDNKRIIFSYKGKVHFIDTNSKEFNEMPNLPEENIGGIGVSRDGNLLYFTVASNESNIWLLDLRQD